MAKKIFLLTILFAIALAAEAAPLPAESTAAKKALSDMTKKMTKAIDEVNVAAPPEKKDEAFEATVMQFLNVNSALKKAVDAGDEKKVVSMARSYEKASEKVLAALPAEKLKTMEVAFNAVA